MEAGKRHAHGDARVWRVAGLLVHTISAHAPCPGILPIQQAVKAYGCMTTHVRGVSMAIREQSRRPFHRMDLSSASTLRQAAGAAVHSLAITLDLPPLLPSASPRLPFPFPPPRAQRVRCC
eukprot:351810-Chlamydomonas_euryale.AAC.9